MFPPSGEKNHEKMQIQEHRIISVSVGIFHPEIFHEINDLMEWIKC